MDSDIRVPKYYKDFTTPDGDLLSGRASGLHNAMYVAIEALEWVQNDAELIGEEKMANTVGKMIASLQKARMDVRDKYLRVEETTESPKD